MIFVYYIVFGLVFILVDWILGKLTETEDPIYNFIEDSLLKLVGENSIIYALILFGGLIGSLLVANTFTENTLGFWIFTSIGVILVGFIGKSWIKN